jgi:ABC-type transporter Mla subunit MlaD
VGLLLAAVLLVSACGADEGLVARVADLERSQQLLRATVEQEAPTPDTDAAAPAAELEVLAGRLDELRAALDTVDAAVAATAAAREDDLTAAGARAEAVDGLLGDVGDRADAAVARAAALEQVAAGLRQDLNDVTDQVASLRAQFVAHRDDPDAHG